MRGLCLVAAAAGIVACSSPPPKPKAVAYVSKDDPSTHITVERKADPPVPAGASTEGKAIPIPATAKGGEESAPSTGQTGQASTETAGAEKSSAERGGTAERAASASTKGNADKPGGPGSASAGSAAVTGGGLKAPIFTLDSLTTKGRVSITPGKVTIVDFWATWCEPCKRSFPFFQELYMKYHASGLEIAAISVDDDKRSILGFAKTFRTSFPIAWDMHKDIVTQYNPQTMPTTYIVDKSGVIRHVHKGFKEGDGARIEAEIRALL